jgi:hypothetical protein
MHIVAIACAGAMLPAVHGCATSGAAAGKPAAASPPEPAMAPPSRSTEDCMFSVVVKNWAAIDEQRFIIYGLTESEAYLGTLFFPTPDLVNNIGMAVVDDDHNGRICGKSSDYVQFRNPTIPGRNLINSLRRITEEEAKDLLAEHGKKPPGKQSQEKKPTAEKTPTEPAQAQ